MSAATRQVSIAQARRFILTKQGLMGERRFVGAAGALGYVKSAGCLQFDPVDVCGRSADIALAARVEGYDKSMLYDLLYGERALIDYFDKNLCILPVEDWPCFERMRARHRSWERSHAEIEGVRAQVRGEIERRGALCAADLDMPDKVHWYWSDTRLARAALEHMYFTGELAVHHKRGTIKYYDLAERLIPHDLLSSPDPHPDDDDYLHWLAIRRIGAVGLMWERASDAWLGMDGFDAAHRARAFERMRDEGSIVPLCVDGLRMPLYMRAEDEHMLDMCRAPIECAPRAELLAPLDCMLWDRRLIEALFGFEYRWEIYTPKEKRRYGRYTLPLLAGEELIGRADIACDRRKAMLHINGIWYEHGAPEGDTARAVEECFERFARFNGCTDICVGDGMDNM